MINLFTCIIEVIYEDGAYHLNESKTGITPDASLPETGKTATVKIVDVASEQLIADITVRG